MEEYYSKWDNENWKAFEKVLRDRIYNKYLVKCDVFQRDDFTCQNIECLKKDEGLTVHHIKWQKNGGEDKVRNCVTLCLTCHQGYHKAKKQITFSNDESLPSHIRGHSYTLKKPNQIDWKKVRQEMKLLRKNLKQDCGLRISWEQIAILLGFLELDYEDYLDE